MKLLLFDFDSTLYPYENGYEQSIKENIYKFMVERLGVPEADVRQTHRELFAKANQTLKGLRTYGGFQFDLDEYFSASRAGCEAYLRPDAAVQAMLRALPHENMYIFTNADEGSAEKGLEVLGIRSHFKRIFGSRWMGEVCKPDREAFVRVVEAAGGKYEDTIFFDDSLKNIRAAKALGITTVYVANRSTPKVEWDVPEVHAVADYVVPFIDGLQSVFPALFEPSAIAAAD